MIFNWWKRIRTIRVLRASPLTDRLWRQLRRELPLLGNLDVSEAVRLRKLTALFLDSKQFNAVQGLQLDERMKAVIAAQACLMVLELGFDSYAGWTEIIVYPDSFRVQRQVSDETGVVHQQDAALSGESWERGPLILAWNEVERDSFHLHKGRNVVIHEFAHKLDALNGRSNGMPPLHPDMALEEWTRALSQAYERLRRQVGHGHACINPYAATNPAEFFAVVSEYFFTAPELLKRHCGEVYDQLTAYYRQDPLQRQGNG